jgi:hypothetical protein
LPVFYRVLDIEPDSEDEDAILERRRQLRRAIEEKYQALNPAAASPAKSEASADSDLVGIQAAEDLKESLEQAEQEMRQKKKSSVTENGASDSPGPAKEEGQRGSKVASQRSSLLAMKKAINGDMFTEEKNMFEEKYLVSGSCSVCVVNPLCVCVLVSLSVCVCV